MLADVVREDELDAGMRAAADVLVDAVHDVVVGIAVVDREHAHERIVDVAAVQRDDRVSAVPEPLVGELVALRELRPQVRIADLQDLGVVVLREDPQLGLARAVDAIVVVDGEAVRAR